MKKLGFLSLALSLSLLSLGCAPKEETPATDVAPPADTAPVIDPEETSGDAPIEGEETVIEESVEEAPAAPAAE